jgi:hypothetical protein
MSNWPRSVARCNGVFPERPEFPSAVYRIQWNEGSTFLVDYRAVLDQEAHNV